MLKTKDLLMKIVHAILARISPVPTSVIYTKDRRLAPLSLIQSTIFIFILTSSGKLGNLFNQIHIIVLNEV
jgi:hypothetical protein